MRIILRTYSIAGGFWAWWSGFQYIRANVHHFKLMQSVGRTLQKKGEMNALLVMLFDFEGAQSGSQ